MFAVVDEVLAPPAPPALAVLDRLGDVAGAMRAFAANQHERDPLAGADREAMANRCADLLCPDALADDAEPAEEAVRGELGDVLGGQRADVDLAEPRLGVHEALELDLAFLAFDQPQDARVTAPELGSRRGVEDTDGTVGSPLLGLQDGGLGAVAHRAVALRVDRPDAPGPAALGVKQTREHGVGVKARPAEPVDRAVGADKSRGAAVADQPVLVDRPVAVHHTNFG